ncbi:3-keto-5-aminohexanoate cleavage protein [Mycolicibacterium goodii]|uniref:3-keto-5-aminohexanoate cleavage protein n=1 Tax=Mycolicibacterium goodii TaxID=134601 RepID=A0ABS6HR78_MYCGD|nr:3-keto-5-aminohexanoate cleavage protein [Mycolicibacterium goodii]MBU8815095.1 3-keto-5-aminohexanoate cleavage protein [Mycolicibacterium goodii]MBU8825126.1 3-keto-5-aminohexanoate cleavage protein [Mycolicibacterium goodii]MBU8838132.1 3-keto-5-aminohexanoate cleavage protein [Mycolicibacterium goodii]OKH70425.1 3-ketoacyl-ACP reductase [Mycobacterium sp. SWH-M5]
MNDKVIITCAVTGGMTVPAQSRAIPITVDEIVRAGVEAAEAGAAVLHVHVREESTGRPVADLDLFERVLTELKKNTDAVIQPTTGGGRGMTVEERASVLKFRPEMATFNAGSFNFGLFPVAARDLPFAEWEREYLEGTTDYIFKNTFADMTYMAEQMRQSDTRPEIEVYDVGHIYNLEQLVSDGVLEPPFNLQFVLGVLGANAAEPDQLIHMLRTAERVFGRESFTWSAAGVGYRGEFGLAALSLILGGNVRVGLEDNLRITRTENATSNAQLVRKAVDLAATFDRTPATPDEARRFLGLKGVAAVGF